MRPLFYPISSMPPFQKYLQNKNMAKENPVTYQKSAYGICLPNGNHLNALDVEDICSILKKIIEK